MRLDQRKYKATKLRPSEGGKMHGETRSPQARKTGAWLNVPLDRRDVPHTYEPMACKCGFIVCSKQGPCAPPPPEPQKDVLRRKEYPANDDPWADPVDWGRWGRLGGVSSLICLPERAKRFTVSRGQSFRRGEFPDSNLIVYVAPESGEYTFAIIDGDLWVRYRNTDPDDINPRLNLEHDGYRRLYNGRLTRQDIESWSELWRRYCTLEKNLGPWRIDS